MRRIGLLALLVAGAFTAGGAVGAPATTEVVRWSPFDAAGRVKTTLTVHRVGTGSCVDTYTTVGDIAYRCGRANYLYFPCWRDGPARTDVVLCTHDPWSKTVSALRSPNLLLYPAMTYLDDAYSPWAVELTSGERCTLVQGAHDSIRRGKHRYTVDYSCDRGNLALVRNLRRGRVWRIGAARYVNLRVGYKLIGDRAIRRAFFGGLPTTMERQRTLAAAAVAAAKRVIHHAEPRAHLDLAWVRLTLPDPRWAYVIFSSVDGKGSFALLRRDHGDWVDASASRPYCKRLPLAIQRQLFLRPGMSKGPLAPPGEQRC